MKPVVIMILASVVTWAIVAAVLKPQTSIEVLFGMLGPLAAVSATWLIVEWGYRQRPTELTSLMMVAFLLKMIFFGGYVAIMLRVAGFRTIPFVASFTSYFIALYVMEALYMKRLFSERLSLATKRFFRSCFDSRAGRCAGTRKVRRRCHNHRACLK
jgi:hypothetical protein